MKYKFFLFLIILNLLSAQYADSAWRRSLNMPADYVNVIYLDVTFLRSNPLYGWACGYEGKTIRTTDGGKTWQGSRIFNTFGFPIDAQLESITFLNESVGYVSGPTSSLNGQGVIFKTINGGVDWFNITPSNVEDLWGNFFLNESVGLVIGGGCGSSQYFWKTTNGGMSWQTTIYNQPGSKMSDCIIYGEDGIGYAVGSGWLWKTTNGGSTWLPIRSTGNVDWHEEITNIDQTFLIPYSEGCFGNTVTSVGGIRFSKDEGRTWLQYNSGVPMFGTFLLDKTRGWAVGFNRTVIYTGDEGKTWNNQNCGIEPGANLDDIFFINDTTGWVVGNGVYEYFIPYAEPPLITVSDGKNNFKLCMGDTVTLAASKGYDAYIWSTGENTREIKVSKAGKYSVRGIIDSICYDGMSLSVDVSFHDIYTPKILLSSGGLPCEGDSVTVTIEGNYLDYEWQDGTKANEIIVTEPTEISVKLVDTNGCDAFASMKIDFLPNPIPRIKSSGRINFCTGDSVRLSTTENYNKYDWYSKDNNQLISTASSVVLYQEGEYFVKVANANGCSGISDTVKVIVRDESNALDFSFSSAKSDFFLDSAYYSQLICKYLKVSNKSNKEVSLSDVYLFRNIAFSTPMSQFPLKIAANSEVLIKICFSPDKIGLNLDTLLISDICTDHLIKLGGIGINESFLDISKCDVPLEFELKDLSFGVSYFGVGSIYPNPAVESVSVKFSAISDNISNFTNNIKIWTMNSIGCKVNTGHTILINPVSDKLINGEIILDTSELLPGLHVVAFDFNGKLITAKFTVIR